MTFTSSDAYFKDLLHVFETECVAQVSKPKTTTFSRRGVLKLTGAAGAGLVLAFSFGPHEAAAAAAATPGKEFVPNAFLSVSPSGSIMIYSKGPEIGQGIKTAFPMIIAEELDAAWKDVRVEQAPVNTAVYGRQVAGGSNSIPMSWDQLRTAGATGRAMLIAAAAKQWNVPAADCTAADSAVTHAASGRSLTYGQLALAAAAMPVPDAKSLKFKTRDQYKLLGQRIGGVDSLKIVTGQPLYGIDHVVPGMVYAAYEKCPAVGGKVASANLDYIKTLPGVKDAFIIEGNGNVTEIMPGVAIIADSTWNAFSAKRALQVKWDESGASKESWTDFSNKAKEFAKKGGAESLGKRGDPDAALKTAAKKLDAYYSYAFLPHAPLEPQNTIAAWKGDVLELWSPTQAPERGQQALMKHYNLPVEKIIINQLRAGGGFGRRLTNDFMFEAAEISKRAGGVPVKLTWTREDDMRHDFYRVGGFHQLSGGLDANGKLVAWKNHSIGFTTDGKAPVMGAAIPADEFPLPLVENSELTQTLMPVMTPIGPWRAPKANVVAFTIQSFLHELSVAGGRDHVEFLLEILGEPKWLPPATPAALNTGRAAAVIKLAAEKSGWGKPLPKGRALGIAFHFSFQGHFAEVAEVSVDANKHVTVHKVVVVGDIGPIINMSSSENQCEGAVIDALSTMMNLQLSIEGGRIQQSNLTEYPILRMKSAPPIVETHFIQSDFTPTGLGEPAFPPLAPAVANAIFTASGHRFRNLPLCNEGVTI
jgi:isoquinoline 1-oxidoreductase beta subunit